MTKVHEDSAKGLQRVFTITVPAAEVAAAVEKRLSDIAKKAKIQGFRPGKAPMTIIKQRFGADAAAEVMDNLIDTNAEKAIKDRKLRPAAQPKVEDVKAEEGKDLSFKLSLEIIPEIEPMDFAKLSFERQVAEVSDKTLAEAIERISKSFSKPEAITEKRAAKTGDIAVIDFDGTVDGVAHDGMKGEDHALELGSNSFIEGFEDQVAGMKAGDKKDVKVTFPEEYHAAHLAGKKAVFAVTLKEIRVRPKTEMNDAAAKEIGFPSLEKLKERVIADIKGNYDKVSRTVLKRALMDELAKKHKFELPPVMVENEFEGIWRQVEAEKAAGRLDEKDAKKSEKELKTEYHEIAERRVRLGLLLAQVAEDQKIEVNEGELRMGIMNEARRYPGQEKAVIEYITKTRGAIERIRAPILEEKVVDYILSKAKITEKTIDADKLLKLQDEE